MDDFTKGYFEAMLWSSSDNHDIPLDRNYTIKDINPTTLAKHIEDCRVFQKECELEFAELDDSAHRHGFDFWLTRNRHGAGYWDRGYGDIGDTLTQAAHAYGMCYISVYKGVIS